MQPLTGELAATPSHPRRWAALAVLMLPVLLISIDNTVLSFALPAISSDLAPSGTQLLWVNDIYPLILSGLLIPAGSLSDRYGRRTMLMLGGLGFTILSVVAGFATSIEWLIAARAGMAIFGAMLMPATLSIIRNIFTNPNERRRAIAIWSAGFASGAALGPIVGGFLLEHFHWGSVFFMSVPILLPLLLLGTWLIPNSKDPNPGPIDPVSIVLIMSTMAPFIYAIKHFAHDGLDLLTVVLLALAITCGLLFTRRQLARTNPMLDVRLFSNTKFSTAILANLISLFSMTGFFYFASQHLQLVSGLSPMQAAFTLVPGTVMSIISGLVVVNLVKRFKPWVIIVAAMLLNAAAYALVLATAQSGSDLTILLAFTMLATGVGFAETLTNDIILSSVPANKAGAASAISETAYETGSVLGTAVLGSILNAAYAAHLVIPEGLSSQQAETASETLGGASQVAQQVGGETGAALLSSAQHAFDSGVVYTCTIALVLMLAVAVLVSRNLRQVRM